MNIGIGSNNNRADIVIADPNHSPHSSSNDNTIIDELTDHEMRKKLKNHINKKTDKITDTICYALLLLYILKNANLSTNYNNLIILLFIYRLIGLYLFLINSNRVYLFYFPNFFLEICLGLMIIDYYPILDNFKIIIILFIIVLKIIQEYFLHVYKPLYILNDSI